MRAPTTATVGSVMTTSLAQRTNLSHVLAVTIARRGPHGEAIAPECANDVYRVCMSRTNIDLDDDLVARAMARTGAPTKRAVVDLALRRLVGVELSPEFLASLRGIGWAGDLDEMRSGPRAGG